MTNQSKIYGRTKTRRLCPGHYETVNTEPVAYISKSCDDEGRWFVSYGEYYAAWGTKKECMDVLDSVADICRTDGEDSHCYPIRHTD